MLLCCTFDATAQNYNLRIHKNGDVQNQWNTSTISNIGLNNGVATFTISGSNIQKNFSEILELCRRKSMGLPQLICRLEGTELRDYLKTVWRAMQDAVERGLATEGVLPGGLGVVR